MLEVIQDLEAMSQDRLVIDLIWQEVPEQILLDIQIELGIQVTLV